MFLATPIGCDAEDGRHAQCLLNGTMDKVIGLKFKDVGLSHKPLTTNAAVNNLRVSAYRNNDLSKQFYLVIAELQITS